MTIASELTKLQTNLTASYTVVYNKGGTIPQHRNFDNLSAAIDSIPSGGTPATGTINITRNDLYDVSTYAYADVQVPAPSGSLPITANGTVDVTNYASAVVNVPTNTPTGTTNITANGTFDVSSYANATVNVSGGASSKYGCTLDGWVGSGPTYTSGTKICNNDISFTGITKIQNNFSMAFLLSGQQNSTSYKRTVTFPDLETIMDYSAQCLLGFAYQIRGCKKISFPKLVTIGNGDKVFEQFCRNASSDLQTVEFPLLETVNSSQCFVNAWQGSFVTEISFPKLKEIKASNVFGSAFSSLMTTGFNLYFYELDEDSFGTYGNQFDSMFSSTTNGTATVHFPPKLRLKIGSWSSVTGGYGAGARVTTVYDLGGTLNFNSTPNTAIPYVYGEEVENNTVMVNVGDTDYYLKDDSISTILKNTATNVVLNEVRTISENLTNGYNTITLDAGVTGLTTIFKCDGITISGGESGLGGSYYLREFLPSGTPLSYRIIGGNNYFDAEGTVTTTGSDITESVTMVPCVVSTFTRPNLTADGTMGGASFAVSASSTYSTSYPAYRAVDDNASNTQWRSNSSDSAPTFTFYNPAQLKISQLEFQWANTTYKATNFTLYASNDGLTWEQIGSYALASATVNTVAISQTSWYKYFRLNFTRNSTNYLTLRDLRITAQQKSPVS